jgi:hypothetical protein
MRDLLEQHLATRLREIGETVSDDVVVPVELELRVRREQRRAARMHRWPLVATAAAIFAIVGGLAVARGVSDRGSVRVGASSSIPAPMHDALKSGTVMLSAYGRYVISLDSDGHRNATMVSGRGDISYARATDTHHAIWYLSHRGGTGCGDVVRADVDGRSSTIVARAVAFDVSRDGSRLALYGAGDLAHDQCEPVHTPGTGRVVIVDLTSRRTSEVALDGVTSLRWSFASSSVVAVRCAPAGCSADLIDVPVELGRTLATSAPAVLETRAGVAERVEFGFDGIYVLRSSPDAASGRTIQTIDRYDAAVPAGAVRLFDGSEHWILRQIVPTAMGTYVVAAPRRRAGPPSAPGADAGLYRLLGGRLVLIRPMSGSMTLTAVDPLPSG